LNIRSNVGIVRDIIHCRSFVLAVFDIPSNMVLKCLISTLLSASLVQGYVWNGLIEMISKIRTGLGAWNADQKIAHKYLNDPTLLDAGHKTLQTNSKCVCDSIVKHLNDDSETAARFFYLAHDKKEYSEKPTRNFSIASTCKLQLICEI
jgi:hypothetical protein